MLDDGASLADKDTHGNTPLHVSVQENNSQMMQLLLLMGADKDALSNFGHTPLFHASSLGPIGCRTTAVLCRTHPGRVQQRQESSSRLVGEARVTCMGTKPAELQNVRVTRVASGTNVNEMFMRVHATRIYFSIQKIAISNFHVGIFRPRRLGPFVAEVALA